MDSQYFFHSLEKQANRNKKMNFPTNSSSSCLKVLVLQGGLLDSSTRRRRRKRVSFQMQQVQLLEERFTSHSSSILTSSAEYNVSTMEEIRSRWYSSEELHGSREDARLCLQALQAANGCLERVDTSRYCLRGIEKFANVQAKIQAQKFHMESVLQQQWRTGSLSTTEHSKSLLVRTCPEQLAALSRYLTQSSREQAHQFALMCAQELIEDEHAVSALLAFSKQSKLPSELVENAGWMSPASAPTSSFQSPNPSVSPSLLQEANRRTRPCFEDGLLPLPSRKRARLSGSNSPGHIDDIVMNRNPAATPIPNTALLPRQMSE